MIVKNERGVIERCLRSTLPLIDYWVIVDTGSDDGTQSVIKNFMERHQVPGELHERPWVNFCHNRNEALELAKGKGDYLLFIDADERFEYGNNYEPTSLEKDYYLIKISYCGLKYSRISLVNNHLNWRWEGGLHEYIHNPKGRCFDTLNGVTNVVVKEGVRSKDPETYHKDIELLKSELEKDQNNSRNVFYLAQSYFDAKNYPEAFRWYRNRVNLLGFPEEVYWSLLKMGESLEHMQCPCDEIIAQYLEAYRYNPSRNEALYFMARTHRKQQNYSTAYQLCQIAKNIPDYTGNFFHYEWVNDYGISLEESICAYWMGNYQESQRLCLDILKKQSLPQAVKECITKNLTFANQKLVELVIEEEGRIAAKEMPSEASGSKSKDEFSKFLLVTGCARSGTGYISTFFSSNGVNIGHEQWGKEGCSSWVMAVDDTYSPWGVCANHVSFEHILHQVRHPLRVINSVYSTEPEQSWKYIRKHIPEIHSEDPLIVKCAKYWYYWNLKAREKAEFSYRLEDLSGATDSIGDIISRNLDKNVIHKLSKTINSRPHKCEFSWTDLEDLLPVDLLENIRSLAKTFGYCEEELKD